jgi:hypothetical protein
VLSYYERLLYERGMLHGIHVNTPAEA